MWEGVHSKTLDLSHTNLHIAQSFKRGGAHSRSPFKIKKIQLLGRTFKTLVSATLLYPRKSGYKQHLTQFCLGHFCSLKCNLPIPLDTAPLSQHPLMEPFLILIGKACDAIPHAFPPSVFWSGTDWTSPS